MAIEFLSFEPVNSGKDSLGIGEKLSAPMPHCCLKGVFRTFDDIIG